jgi:hypothetical protein
VAAGRRSPPCLVAASLSVLRRPVVRRCYGRIEAIVLPRPLRDHRAQLASEAERATSDLGVA